MEEDRNTLKPAEPKEVLLLGFLPVFVTIITIILLPEDIKRYRLSIIVSFILALVFYLLYISIIKKMTIKQTRKKRLILKIAYCFFSLVAIISSFVICSNTQLFYYTDRFNAPLRMLYENDVSDFEFDYEYHDTGSTITVLNKYTGENIPHTNGEIKRSISKYVGKESIVAVPLDVLGICDDAFSGVNNNCLNIKHIILPEGMETIGKHAFFKCYNLQSIVLPRSVSLIDDSAFEECNNVTMIVYKDTYSYVFCKEHGLHFVEISDIP